MTKTFTVMDINILAVAYELRNLESLGSAFSMTEVAVYTRSEGARGREGGREKWSR